jgi:DNA replication protein DnaC
MRKGDDLLLDLEEQMQTIKLPLMALKLDELYRSPKYLNMDKLDFLSELLAPEYRDKVTKTINNRLRTAHIIGTPCEINSCKDTNQRSYEPHGAPKTLSSLRFIEDGQNVCILGASDSGKTYLAKALGASACEKFRVSYNRCSELLESLVALKTEDYSRYERRMRKILNFHLLILDDFLLNTIADEREIKILLELMEKRIELSRSTIICSQREPESWKSMIMNDEVSANAIMKRATKHYVVMIQLKGST